ncbi:uroporphyrinogen-III C-methyltransferase [Enemella sp. A6]|uniref:uroporphyrinogen-III C-methyltransferase n=1 Tax=Enemella sp. A6 TaxID=3440152 RepID=UPI003EBD37A7
MTDPGEPGTVTLVGGGPGDEGLLTLAGLAAIRTADVLICDRLAPLGVLREARPDAQVIHVGKIPRGEYTPQEVINALLVQHARAGKQVVRFKGGDSFVFGRGGEEWIACRRAGVPVRVVPGVTSSVAAAALAGIPVTHRHLVQGFAVVSGHAGPEDERDHLNWSALATSGLTIVVLMGVAALGRITARLIAEGLPADTPAACIADASMPSQRSVTGTVATIDTLAAEAGIAAPAVTVIGHVVTALETADTSSAAEPSHPQPATS